MYRPRYVVTTRVVVCQAVMRCMGGIIALQLVLQFSELFCSVAPCYVVL